MLPWRPSPHQGPAGSNAPVTEVISLPNASLQQGQQQGAPQNVNQEPTSPTNPPNMINNMPPAPIPASSTAAGVVNLPQLNLSHVLHFLQSEFRKYERDRNEWDIERGEMRARIALLEGERRGNENARSDLLRRVRMLEFALKGERSKYLSLNQAQANNAQNSKTSKEDKPASDEDNSSNSGSGSGSGIGSISAEAGPSISITPASATLARQGDKISAIPQHVTLANSGSSRPTSPLSQTSNSLNGISDRLNSTANLNLNVGQALEGKADKDKATSGSDKAAGVLGGGQNTWNPAIGRDPRGRARSRDYLKQCLQEITYLTSATTLNPLPEQSASGVPRPRKIMVSLPNHSRSPAAGLPVNLTNVASSTDLSSVPANSSLPPPTTSQPIPTFANNQPPAYLPISVPRSQAFASTAVTSSISFTPNSTTDTIKNVSLPDFLPSSASPQITSKPEDGVDLIMAATDQSARAVEDSMDSESQAWPNGILPPVSVGESYKPPATPTSPSKELPSDLVTPFSVPLPPVSLTGPVSSPMVSTVSDDMSDRLTAIFRPKSGAAWKDQLREEHQRAVDRATSHKGIPTTSLSTDSIALGLDHLVSASHSPPSKDSEDVAEEKEEESVFSPISSSPSVLEDSSNAENDSTKDDSDDSQGDALDTESKWKSRRILRSHMDAVRAVAFGRSSDLALVSGSDDMTVKVWRLNPHTLHTANAKSAQSSEIEPQVTLRGHSAPVTSLAISPTQTRVYSASLDQTVQVWSMPPRDRDTYAPVNTSLRIAAFEGHTDAIWDIAVLPLRIQEEGLLASASADGSVKLWNTDELNSPLKLSWKYNGTSDEDNVALANGIKELPAPTCLAVVYCDLRKIAVAYQNSIVKLFDIETGREVVKLKSDETYDGTTSSQINSIVTHPTLPILATAHEDRYIRIFDSNTGECTHSMLAHQDAVTSIDIDSGGLNLVSAGHDCSIRFWDLLSTRTCLQEISSHRSKAGEGILSVQYHPSLPYVATGGADGTCKVYSFPS